MDSLQKKPVMGVPTCLHPRGMDTIESDRRDEKRLKESQEDVHKYKKIKKKKTSMGKHMGSYYSHLIFTFLTHLALSLPWFHAPQIEAEPQQ